MASETSRKTQAVITCVVVKYQRSSFLGKNILLYSIKIFIFLKCIMQECSSGAGNGGSSRSEEVLFLVWDLCNYQCNMSDGSLKIKNTHTWFSSLVKHARKMKIMIMLLTCLMFNVWTFHIFFGHFQNVI